MSVKNPTPIPSPNTRRGENGALASNKSIRAGGRRAFPLADMRHRFSWALLMLLGASLLIHVAVYAASSDSTMFRLLALGIGGLALTGVGVGAWGLAGLPRLEAIRRRVAGGRWLYLTAALLVGFTFGAFMRPEWVYAHTGVTLALLLTLVYTALFDSVPKLSRAAWIAIGGLALILTLVRVLALSYFPVHNVADEGWVLGWAMSYVKTGQLSDWISYYGGADVQRFMLPVAWWISLFGAGFWQTRLFFFLAVMLVVALTGLTARNLYGNGWIAVLLAFGSAVLMSAAVIRHDVGLALGVAASIWLWTEAVKRGKARLHALAGLMIGLGMFAHYHAVFMGAALLVGLYAPRLLAERRLDRTALWFALGGLIGAALLVILQIIPDWQGFVSVRQVRSPLTLADYGIAFARHIGNIAALSRYEFLLLTAGLIAALWRFTRAHAVFDLSLILIVLVAHVGLALFAAAVPAPQYLVPLSPVYALLIAGLFQRPHAAFAVPIEESSLKGADEEDSSRLQAASSIQTEALSLRRHKERVARTPWTTVAAAIFMSVGVGYTLASPLAHVLRGNPIQLQPPPAVDWLRANVQPNETLVAEPYYFLFLTDTRFISPETPQYARTDHRARLQAAALQTDISAFADDVGDLLTIEGLRYRTAAWDEIAPDVVVIDRSLSTCCSPPITYPAYLDSRGYVLAATIDGGTTPVYIYRKMTP